MKEPFGAGRREQDRHSTSTPTTQELQVQPSDISIVIPARNEAGNVAKCIRSARAAGASEIIVADGRSQDDTVAAAKSAGATHVIASLPGRGIQQNAGAMFAKGDLVLFLHADNRLGESALRQITELPEDFTWGAMRQRIESTAPIYRSIEAGNAWRVRGRGMAFGDQAIFVRRDIFKREGGFPEIPLMEDVELSKKLRRLAKPMLIDGPVHVSARRWQKRGAIRQTLLNWRIQLGYRCGVSPETLVRWYR